MPLDGTRQFTISDMMNAPEMSTYDPHNKPVSWTDSYGAAFEADSTMLDYINSLEAEHNPVDGYNPVPDVPQEMTYFMQEYMNSKSPEETAQITGRLNYEQRRNMDASEHISAAVLGSFSGTLFGSPEYLPLLLWAPGTIGRGALAVGRAAKTFGTLRHAINAAKLGGLVAAEETVHEGLLHRSTLSRTMKESYLNVGFSGLLGATIGGVSSAVMKSRYVDALEDATNDAVNGHSIKMMDDYLEPQERMVVHDDNKVTLISDTGKRSSKKSFDDVHSAERYLKERAGETIGTDSAGAARVGRGLDEAPRRAKWRESEFMRKRPFNMLKSANVSLERPMLWARSAEQHEVTNKFWGHDKPTNATEQGYKKQIAMSRQADQDIAINRRYLKKSFYNGFARWMGDENTKMLRLKTNIPNTKLKEKFKQFNDEVDWALRNNNKSPTGDKVIEEIAQDLDSNLFAKVKDDAVQEGIYGYEKVPVLDDDGAPIIGPNGKMMTRDEPIDPAKNVKYANSWAPKGWVPQTLRRDIKDVHEELARTFKEERIEKAVIDDKGKLAEDIHAKKIQIETKRKVLARDIDKAQKEVDAKQVKPLASRSTKVEAEKAQLKKWNEELVKAQTELKKLDPIKRNIEKAQKEVDDKLIPPAQSSRGLSGANTAALKEWQSDLLKAQNKLKTAKQQQHRIDVAQKKVDEKLVPPQPSRIGKTELEHEVIKEWKSDLLSAHKKLKTAQDNLKNNKLIIRWRENIAKAELDMKNVGSEKWLDKKIKEDDLFEGVESDVSETFGNMVYGKQDGRVYGNEAHKPSSTKERMVPIHDNTALEREWLSTDVMAYGQSYLESTMRPTIMKRFAGDTEMESVNARVMESYGRMSDDALAQGDTKLANSLIQEGKDMVKMNIVAKNRFYHRSLVPKDPKSIGANLSRILRDFNVMIRMGGVTPTSLSDVGRYNMAKMYAPEIGRFGTTVRDGFKSMRKNMEVMQDFGLFHEVDSNLRAARMLDIDDPNPAQWWLTRQFDKMAYGLMRGSLLSEFTDLGKGITGNIVQNETWRLAKNWDNLTPKSKAKLANIGFDENMARGMQKEFKAGKIQYLDSNERAVATNWGTWTDQELAKDYSRVIFKESERILGTPNELTSPIFADSEMAKMLLQFKSFSLAAHQQITTPMADRIKQGDIMAMQTIATALAMGVITEVIKAAIAGDEAWERLGNYTPSDWAYRAIDRSAMIPLLVMGFNGMDTFLQNNLSKALEITPRGRASRHSWEQAMGPTPSLVTDAYSVLSAMSTGNFDQRDLATLRRLLPFNNLAWIARGVDELEEYAGPALGVPKSGASKSRKIER